jgi:hypothetical protein
MMKEEIILEFLHKAHKPAYRIYLNPKHKEIWDKYLTKRQEVYYYSGEVVSFNDDISVDKIVYFNVRDVLDAFEENINDQKDIPTEYTRLVNEYFWELI